MATTAHPTHDPHVRPNGSAVADALVEPTRHAPEVQLALSAVLVVLAGPVAQAVAPESAVVAGASAVLLVVGLVLAVLAAFSLLRSR